MTVELDELRKNASPAFIAANPEIFGSVAQCNNLQHSAVPSNLTAPASWKDFEEQVIKWFQGEGWKVAHFRPAKTEKGWRTAVSADGKGFPDVLAVKGKLCIVAETKTGAGKASTEQVEWMLVFERAGIRAFLITPETWDKTREQIGEMELNT